jgi:hypothetical protein
MGIKQENELLSMICLGVKGDEYLQDGVHLRWSFAPFLGFPRGGFKLFRRPHDVKIIQEYQKEILLGKQKEKVDSSGKELKVEGVTFSKQKYPLTFIKTGIWFGKDYLGTEEGLLLTSDPLIIEFDNKKVIPWWIFLNLAYKRAIGYIEIKAYKDDTVIYEVTWGKEEPPSLVFIVIQSILNYLGQGWQSAFTTIFISEGIDKIEIRGRDAVLERLLYVPEDCGWEELTTIYLPVTSSPYYEQWSSESSKEIAEKRLGDSPQTLLPKEVTPPSPESLKERYLGVVNFSKLHEALVTILQSSYYGSGKLMNEVIQQPTEGECSGEIPLLDFILLSAIDPNIARILGLYYVDDKAPTPCDYKIEGTWIFGGLQFFSKILWYLVKILGPLGLPGVIEVDPSGKVIFSISWTCFNVKIKEKIKEDQQSLAYSAGLTAKLYYLPPFLEQGKSASMQPIPVVGLKWDLPNEDTKNMEEQHVMYHVERDGQLLTVDTVEENKFAQPVVVSKPEDKDSFPYGYFTDKPSYGSFEYRIRGIDIFGRVSKPSESVTIKVEDNISPPPPINVKAAYLDAADPYLLDSDKADLRDFNGVNSNTPLDSLGMKELVRIEWEWTKELELQAPDACGFNIYLKHGILNTLLGRIVKIEENGEDYCNLTTSLNLTGFEENCFGEDKKKGYLLSQGESFKIKTVGENGTLTVKTPIIEKLDGNKLRLKPIIGPCSLKLGEGLGSPYYKKYISPKDWQGVETEPGTIQTPIKVDKENGEIEGSSIPTGLKLNIMIGKQNGTTRYKLLIHGINLGEPELGFGKLYFQVGISTSRIKYDGTEKEGHVSIPAGAFKVDRTPPKTPKILEPESKYATKADTEGSSYYTLKWNGIYPYKYNIYRAVDINLKGELSDDEKKYSEDLDKEVLLRAYAADEKKKKQFLRMNKEPISPDSPEEISSEEKLMTYTDKLPGNVNNRYVYHISAISPSGVESGWPELTEDDINLLKNSELNANDAANLNELIKKLKNWFLVVNIPDITPPPIPQVLGIEPGDQKITIRWRWREGLDQSVIGYKLFKTTKPEFAGDIRNMIPVIEGLLTEENSVTNEVFESESIEKESLHRIIDNADGKIWEFKDLDVNFGKTYYYQFIAVKELGDGTRIWSQPLPKPLASKPLKLSKPKPPKLENIVRINSATINIYYTPSEEKGLELLLMRKVVKGSVWWIVGDGWFPQPKPVPGEWSLYKDDKNVQADLLYEYKFRVRDKAGNVSESDIISEQES